MRCACGWPTATVTDWFGRDQTKLFFHAPQVAVYADQGIPVKSEWVEWLIQENHRDSWKGRVQCQGSGFNHENRRPQSCGNRRGGLAAAATGRYGSYVRKTSQMKVVAGALAPLSPPFRVRHGLQISYKGRELYLEHLITGPTGVYLVEWLDHQDSAWLGDLARSIEFVQAVLGVNAGLFTCLAISTMP